MSALTIVSDRNRKHLVNLLGCFDSDHECECAAAVLMANRHLRGVIGWSWVQLVERGTRPAPIALPPRPPRPRRDTPSVVTTAVRLRWLINSWAYMSAWEQLFAVDLHDHGAPFTPKRLATIERITTRAEACSGAACGEVVA